MLHSQQGLLFSTPRRRKWTSACFRHTFVCPLLEELRVLAEPTLRMFSDRDGERLQDRITGMHSWRRAARSHVQRAPRSDAPRPPEARLATSAEVTEHGRWRFRHKPGESMELHCSDWEVRDRILVTLLCMQRRRGKLAHGLVELSKDSGWWSRPRTAAVGEGDSACVI